MPGYLENALRLFEDEFLELFLYKRQEIPEVISKGIHKRNPESVPEGPGNIFKRTPIERSQKIPKEICGIILRRASGRILCKFFRRISHKNAKDNLLRKSKKEPFRSSIKNISKYFCKKILISELNSERGISGCIPSESFLGKYLEELRENSLENF